MRKILFFLLFGVSVCVEAQNTFVKLYSNGAPYWYQPFIKTFDGNLLFSSYWHNSYITKTDQDGNILWIKEFVIQGSEVIEAITQTIDSCYILAGSIDSISGTLTDRKLFLLKVDSNGIFLWIKIFDNWGRGIAIGLFETADSGFFIPASNFQDTYLVRTDKNGDTLWTKILSSTGVLYSTNRTLDGGYILSGNTTTGESVLIKIDSLGNITWSKNYSSGGLALSVFQTSDSGYIVTGCINCLSLNDDGFVMKTNGSGDIIWVKNFISPLREIGLSVNESRPNEYAISGFVSDTSGYGTFLIKFNSFGDTIWTATYPVNSGGISLMNSDDGGFLISSQHNMGAWWDCGLIKTDENGITDCSQKFKSLLMQDTVLQTNNFSIPILSSNTIISSIQVQQNIIGTNVTTVCFNTSVRDETKDLPLQILLSPNPFHSTAKLNIVSSLIPKYSGANAQLRIYNTMGSLVRIEQIPKTTSYILHRNDLSDGLYFFELRTSNSELIGNGKFIIE